MELKIWYFLFLMLVIPGSFAAMDYRLLTAGVFLMIFVPVWFQATSIEFFTVTAYRMTSRGMEISIVYLTALMVCLGLLIRGFKFHLLSRVAFHHLVFLLRADYQRRRSDDFFFEL